MCPCTLAKYNPKIIIIFSRDEMKQWDIAKKIEGSSDNTRCQNPTRINCGQKIASDFIYCSDNNIA